MENTDRLKELKREKRHCIIDYHKAKGAIFGYALACSIIAGNIITLITGNEPYTYKTTKKPFVIEYLDSEGDAEQYYTFEALKAIDLIEVDVFSKWTYEDGHYSRYATVYELKNTDELKNKLMNNINNITINDLNNIQFEKRNEYLQTAEKLDEEVLNRGAYVAMCTCYLGKKVYYEQSFEENLFDIGLFTFLVLMIYRFIKEATESSSTEYLNNIIENYDCIQNEIDWIKKTEKVRKKDNK